jgi:hypothetical protein
LEDYRNYDFIKLQLLNFYGQTETTGDCWARLHAGGGGDAGGGGGGGGNSSNSNTTTGGSRRSTTVSFPWDVPCRVSPLHNPGTHELVVVVVFGERVLWRPPLLPTHYY